ncbi:MAG TPA: multiheme c-type cytochrome [Polyangiales bacterium]
MTQRARWIVAAMIAVGLGVWTYHQRTADPLAEPGETSTQAAVPSAASPPAAPEHAQFVGSERCKTCHATEFTSWSGSHHAKAMLPATPEHVLGSVDGGVARAALPGVQARFFRDDAGTQVELEGSDGGVQRFQLAYTFGVGPLQQYLVRFPNGRLQALPVAWDSRALAAQGQRWFQLYPDVHDHHDQLHWSGPYQNWNMMCGECHVTGYVKRYDARQDAYDSKWSELGVGCEACHGPGSAHLAWAQAGGQAGEAGRGFVRDLKARGEFVFRTPDQRIAARSDTPPPDANAECAACHARAGSLVDAERRAPRSAMTQHHRLTLLTSPEYWPTGEQRDEVFVWGSFAASKMAARGVTCGDCHEPHSGAPLAQDNSLCVRCHQPSVFDAPAHHRHAPGSAGAQCVGCHMAEELYMGVDLRRDHSFQLPRPDLTLTSGSPNACNRCHVREKPEWAAARLDQWLGKRWRERPHFGHAFASADRHSSAAQRPLAALALDASQPAIVRATALRRWRGVPLLIGEPRLLALVDDAEPLVRAEALSLLERSDPAERWRRARARLEDADRLVRLEATELLCGLPREVTGSDGAELLRKAFLELTTSLEQQADFPANATQLGQVYLRSGDLVNARRWFEHALRRDPQYVEAYVRLSELARMAGDQQASSTLLEQALTRLPKAADLHYASGLSLVRLGKKREGTERLGRALELSPEDAGMAYTYAVALQDQGQLPRAIEVLERTLRTQPENGELLQELLRIGVSAHDPALIQRHLSTFSRLFPEDPHLPDLQRAAERK